MDETRDLDREAVIQRVWKRVMEGREETFPLALKEDPEPHGSLQNEEGDAGILPAPMPQERSDFPTGAVFLGEGSLDCAPFLQEMIRRELTRMREYQALAKRTGGPQARVLQALAQEGKGHAKRLSAACFLISGVRYWPEGGRTAPPTSYLGTLRHGFGEEQRAMTDYLAGAEATSDPCLRQLFLELAKTAWERACKIRALVEQA
ncbi:MAG: hypothetical protein IKU62_02255 [Ruminiclostridium sp.]|nr:hypothetical protein [Ruminiclostridium sp.]